VTSCFSLRVLDGGRVPHRDCLTFRVGHFRKVRGVKSGYRRFYVDDGAGAASSSSAPGVVAKSGEEFLVSPQDLRRTNYGPTHMHFLLSEPEPATYYMEVNPWAANLEGPGLAEDLREADWLILTSEWDNRSEPNDSIKYGPSEPNEVVRDFFCLRLERGQYRLYERCDRGA